MESASAKQLEDEVAWAISQRLGAQELVPLLERLLERAEPGSACATAACAHLAALILHERPWRAAVLLRDVLSRSDEPQAWGLLGCAHTLLGHFRLALRAYQRAVALDGNDATCLHNLGHLLDCAAGQPAEALPLLQRARALEPRDPEIASSLAHALLRVGQRGQARAALRATHSRRATERTLQRWSEPQRALRLRK